MNALPITSTIALALAGLMFILTMIVSMRRIELGKQAGDIAKYPYGDANDETLKRRIRAFGNFIEYVPMALILLALIEYHGATPALLWWLGGAFAIGRLLHALGMLYCPHFPLPRILGMFATYAVLLIPAWWLVTHFL